MTRRLLTAALALALLALVAAAGASAAPWACDASVIRGSVGPAPPVEPIAANKNTAECATQSAGGAPPEGLPGGASGGLAFARTRADGAATNPAGQRVSAEASLGELRIRCCPGSPACRRRRASPRSPCRASGRSTSTPPSRRSPRRAGI